MPPDPVRRNIERFPEDFMFQLTNEEWTNLQSQIVTASWGGRRNEPFAFTEHGVLMYIELLFEYIDRLQEKHDSTRIMSKKKEEIGFKIGERSNK